jgi:MerR family transcriptional regulator, light-induced transcriptional regulator
MTYRIKTVASLTGISPTTLRAWERRYELVEPRRTHSGYRVYSDLDVATLSRVKRLVDRGFKVGEAISIVRRGMQEPDAGELSGEEVGTVRYRLLRSLLLLDRRGTAEAYARLSGLPVERQVDDVLLPLLRQVGAMWAEGDCSVAQEHFASAFARERLVSLLDSVSGFPFPAPEAVCAGAPGELHEFGLLAAAIHLSVRGWKVTYLGADLPVDQLEPIARQRRPALVCTSVICARTEPECLALASAIRAVCPPETMVVVGGRGLPDGLPGVHQGGVHFFHELSDLTRLRHT